MSITRCDPFQMAQHNIGLSDINEIIVGNWSGYGSDSSERLQQARGRWYLSLAIGAEMYKDQDDLLFQNDN